MDLEESRSAQVFRRSVRQWVNDNVPNELRGSEDFDQRHSVDMLLAEQGYLGFSWPVEYGGAGADPELSMVLDEELARAGIPLSRSPSRFGISLVGPTLMRHGTRKQKERFLPAILHAQEVWCQGFSEPEAGSDLANVQTSASDRGDHFELNGTKIWTTQAQWSDWCFVLARTDPKGARHKNLSYLLVPMHQPGIRVQPLVQMTGTSEFNQVFFEKVKVPKDNVVGQIGEGWQVAMTTLSSERSYGQTSRYFFYLEQLRRAAQNVEAAINSDMRAAYYQQLGYIFADLMGIQNLGYHMTSLTKSGHSVGYLPSVTKLWWSETHQRLADLGYRIVSSGKTSSDEEAFWLRLFLESRAETIYAGTSQIQRNVIAQRVLGLPKI